MELLSSAMNENGEKVKKRVMFNEKVEVAILPESERKEARNARKRFGEAGPLHNEIWDGDMETFVKMRYQKKNSQSYFVGKLLL